jgi:hypothetical protein
MARPGTPRPLQFAAFPGDSHSLISYRRTTTERGMGLLLNPWFYLGSCCAVFAGIILIVTIIIVLVVWLANRSSYRRARIG